MKIEIRTIETLWMMNVTKLSDVEFEDQENALQKTKKQLKICNLENRLYIEYKPFFCDKYEIKIIEDETTKL